MVVLSHVLTSMIIFSDIPLPEYIANEDDEYTADYIKSLRYMAVMSNIAGKIIRYNYSVQTQLPGAFKVMYIICMTQHVSLIDVIADQCYHVHS